MKSRIQNKYLSATINAFGAELVSLIKNEHNYIWTIDEKFWNKTSPVLFPIVGQLKNNSFTYNNKQYTLPRHGFARDYDFDVAEKNANSVTFTLSENQNTLKLYPFQFELEIKYELIENSLSISYNVKNKSGVKMPFSIGAHPAFAINNDIKNYQILFEKEEDLITNELQDGLLSGNQHQIKTENKKLNLNYSLFEKDALILKTLNSKSITILENNKPYMKINLGNFSNLGIWTKIDAPFLCIEPWLGYSDSQCSNGNLYNKEGIQILEANNQFETSFSIEIL